LTAELQSVERQMRAVTQEFAEGDRADRAESRLERFPSRFAPSSRSSLFAPLPGLRGVECDTVSYVVVVEELSRASAAVAITVSVHNSVAAGPITLFGTDEQKAHWLPRLAKGSLGAFALTEPGSGSDAAALITRAVRAGDEYVLNGSKTFVTNGKYADVFVLLARTAESFLRSHSRRRGAPGLVIRAIDKMGIADRIQWS
jgi:alkylation response protein AidB-like acyl-CoA dehydrogenase